MKKIIFALVALTFLSLSNGADAKRVNPNPELRAQQYITDAKSGHAGAQLIAGELYENGYGVTKNKVEAYAWYSLAANQNEPRAQEALNRLKAEMKSEEIEAGKSLSTQYLMQYSSLK